MCTYDGNAMQTIKYGIIWSQKVENLTSGTKQKTYLTKVVKEYALMMEMPCRPINMESFGHQIFILLQQFL